MDQKQLNESVETTLDRLFSYLRPVDIIELMRMFTSPYTQWPAFRAGLIDKDGNILRPPKSQKERAYLQPLMIFFIDLKKHLLPSFRLTNYDSYIQAITRLEKMQNRQIGESVDGGGLASGDIATYDTPFEDKTKTFKVNKKMFKRIGEQLLDNDEVDFNSFPLKMQQEIKQYSNPYFYIIDEDKNLIKIHKEQLICRK